MAHHKMTITRPTLIRSDNPWMKQYPTLKRAGARKLYAAALYCYHDTPISYLAGNDKALRAEACKVAGFVSEGDLSMTGYRVVDGEDKEFEEICGIIRKLFPHSTAIMLLQIIQENIFEILRNPPDEQSQADYLQKAISVIRSDVVAKMTKQITELQRLSSQIDKLNSNDDEPSTDEEDDWDEEDDGEVL